MELLNLCIIHIIKLGRRNGVVGNEVGMELDGVVDSRISTLDTDTDTDTSEYCPKTLFCDTQL